MLARQALYNLTSPYFTLVLFEIVSHFMHKPSWAAILFVLLAELG
jgi:hypothetical protein